MTRREVEPSGALRSQLGPLLQPQLGPLPQTGSWDSDVAAEKLPAFLSGLPALRPRLLGRCQMSAVTMMTVHCQGPGVSRRSLHGVWRRASFRIADWSREDPARIEEERSCLCGHHAARERLTTYASTRHSFWHGAEQPAQPLFGRYPRRSYMLSVSPVRPPRAWGGVRGDRHGTYVASGPWLKVYGRVFGLAYALHGRMGVLTLARPAGEEGREE